MSRFVSVKAEEYNREKGDGARRRGSFVEEGTEKREKRGGRADTRRRSPRGKG